MKFTHLNAALGFRLTCCRETTGLLLPSVFSCCTDSAVFLMSKT